ncbi:hypothetical protein GCM10020295_63550 [Streptomyces cinereospinus]
MPTIRTATPRLAYVIGLSKWIGASRTVKPIIAMKCMVQMPEAIATDPRASQEGRQEPPTRKALVVQRRPRAPPRQAMTKATSGVTRP